MQATAKRTAKRGAAKKRALVRGEPVVRGILAAALEELASAGYRALRIEDVATRAGVNKTTVYRRWPTKEDLVRAEADAAAAEAAAHAQHLEADLRLAEVEDHLVHARGELGDAVLAAVVQNPAALANLREPSRPSLRTASADRGCQRELEEHNALEW